MGARTAYKVWDVLLIFNQINYNNKNYVYLLKTKKYEIQIISNV